MSAFLSRNVFVCFTHVISINLNKLRRFSNVTNSMHCNSLSVEKKKLYVRVVFIQLIVYLRIVYRKKMYIENMISHI